MTIKSSFTAAEPPSINLPAQPVKPRLSPGARLLRSSFHYLGLRMPSLTARVAYWLWFRPGRKQRGGDKPLLFKQAEWIPLKWQGKRVAAYAWGQGSPVLFVHGWGSSASKLDMLAAALVAAGNRVIAFDAPAHGRSAGSRTNVIEITGVILELDRIHGPFAAVVAHSFGGLCTVQAMRRGLRVKRLVCISAPSHFDFTLASYGRMLNLPNKVVARLSTLVEEQFGADIWSRMSMHTEPGEISVPALIIHDEDDMIVAVTEGECVAAAWPRARLLKTNGLGHRRILADEMVIAEVSRFINSSQAG